MNGVGLHVEETCHMCGDDPCEVRVGGLRDVARIDGYPGKHRGAGMEARPRMRGQNLRATPPLGTT